VLALIGVAQAGTVKYTFEGGSGVSHVEGWLEFDPDYVEANYRTSLGYSFMSISPSSPYIDWEATWNGTTYGSSTAGGSFYYDEIVIQSSYITIISWHGSNGPAVYDPALNLRLLRQRTDGNDIPDDLADSSTTSVLIRLDTKDGVGEVTGGIARQVTIVPLPLSALSGFCLLAVLSIAGRLRRRR
jgi:hypothetical protein